MEKNIKCNACGNQIPLKDAILQELKDELYTEIAEKEKAIEKAKEKLKEERVELNNRINNAKKSLKQQLEQEKLKMSTELKTEIFEEVSGKINMLEEELRIKNKIVRDLEDMEYKLVMKEDELEEEKRRLDLTITKRLNEEKEKLFNKAKDQAFNELSSNIKYLEEELAKKETKITEASKLQLKLLADKQELAEKQKNIELEIAKKLEEQQEEIRKKERERVTEEHKFLDLQKDKKIETLIKEIENLQIKAKQESQKLQGDALEEELRAILGRNFPIDRIEAVPNGIKGADLIHDVINEKNEECGRIVIETKNTKQWQDDWIVKLKKDTREVKGDISIIVSKTLPNDIKTFKFVEGVWVTNYASFISLMVALRISLIKIHNTKIAMGGRNQKTEILYKYLCGNEFRQRIEAMTDTLSQMDESLDSEKRAMNKLWAERQKHIEYIATNVASLHGEVRGIIGTKVTEIDELKLLSMEDKKRYKMMYTKEEEKEQIVQ